MLTIAQLKKLIAGLPDDMHVVTNGSDHSYNNVRGWVVDAAWDEGYGGHFEYATDAHMSKTEVRSQVLVISDW